MLKLQHLAVIFVVIMLPISLIISAYTQNQIDTLILQNQYDAKLMDATYDAIKAFDMNTTIDDTSNVSDTLKKDILAAIQTFMNSYASSMGAPGNSDTYVRPYVPAALFTLYDGYYIYSPILTNDGYEYTLQPYNYYSVRYKDKNRSGYDVVINYTLDNYVVVYGYVNGNYIVKSGYLISSDNLGISHHFNRENIRKTLPVAQLDSNGSISNISIENVTVTNNMYARDVANGGRFLYESNELYYIDPTSANNYYTEGQNFTRWANIYLSWITPSMAIRNNEPIEEFASDTTTHIFQINRNNNPDNKESVFNTHRISVIKNTIENHLNYVITLYANSAGANEETKYNFRLPQISAKEWLRISSNVCFVPFVQGIPMGSRFYNNYCVVQSSTNKFFVTPENIYFVSTEADSNGQRYYHKIDCPHLLNTSEDTEITGFSSYEFQQFKYVDETDGKTKYYYRRTELPCYYCIVENTYTSIGKYDEDGNLDINSLLNRGYTKKVNAYYTALAREKYNQYATTNYFGK